MIVRAADVPKAGLRVLSETFARQGEWLFRRRGWLPILLAPILADAMLGNGNPDALADGPRNVVCAVIALAGIGIRAYTTGHASRGTSGGNTREQIATSLNVTGTYSVVRHPLYLGNCLMWLAVALFTQNLVAVALILLVFWLYYERIMMAEEAFLLGRFGDAYRAWAAKTPAFLPKLRLWVPAATPFDWRNAVRREYSGIYWLILIVSVLQFARDSLSAGRPVFAPGWLALLAISTALAVVIMVLRRTTDLIGRRR